MWRCNRSDMIDFSTPLAGPLEGMTQAESAVNQSASRIAQLGTPAGDSVDLSSEMVNLIQAKNDFKANVASAKVEDQMTRSLLDIVA